MSFDNSKENLGVSYINFHAIGFLSSILLVVESSLTSLTVYCMNNTHKLLIVNRILRVVYHSSHIHIIILSVFAE
jgi:hypothetical protein